MTSFDTVREALKLGGAATNAEIRQALDALSELERLAGPEPILIVQHGEICYKSQDDDQSYGMWCPVTPDAEHGLRNGTQLYAAPVAQQDEHLTITWDEQQTRILAVTMQDEDGRILKVLAEAPATAQKAAAAQGFRDGAASVTQQEPVGYLHPQAKQRLENGETVAFRKTPYAGEPTLAVYVGATPPAQQPQYEAADMASAAAQGFRDGVASVTQQQEPVAWAMPKGDGTFIDVITPAEHAREEGSYTVPLFAHPVAQQPQAEAVPVVDRVYEAAKRLVDHADFQLGGVLSAKSKSRDIPSNAASKVKARHLASLRDALAKAPPQAEAVPQKPKLVGWRTSDYLMETSDKDKADNWAVHNEILPIFEGDPYTKLVAAPQQAEAVPSSDLSPDEGDPVTLWAEIWRLREAVKGPDGYATWQDAATAERIRRVRAESVKDGTERIAWIRHDWGGTGKRTLTFEGPTYPVPVRDEVVNPVWTPLYKAAPQQAEAVPNDVDWPDVEGMAHSALQEALSFGLSHDVFHRFGKSVMQKTIAAAAQGEKP